MEKCIKSILDNDLYKHSQQWAVLKLYPSVYVSYVFNNRNIKNKFNVEAVEEIKNQINAMSRLFLLKSEKEEFQKKCPFLPPAYFEYLQNYRFDPSEVIVTLENVVDGWGDLKVVIQGLWHRTILWEVPLLAIISEVYFAIIDTNWSMKGQEEQFHQKGDFFDEHEIYYSEFGTRRRRSHATQDLGVKVLKTKKTFIGTSNVYLSIKHDCKAMGTLAHEFFMAHMVLNGITRCNYYALTAWNNVYQGDLGIALTDTIGTDQFFKDFDPVLSRLYDGVRHDSGCPFAFIDKTVAHYTSIRLNASSKVALFSDGLNGEKCLQIKAACKDEIGFRKLIDRYGIGTWLSNDFKHIDDSPSPALNIVIKLSMVNGKYVVKLSDVETKAIGNDEALRVTRWLVNGTPLDKNHE